VSFYLLQFGKTDGHFYCVTLHRDTARCRCKIRYVSKFTAAPRGSPCDNTAFLLIHVSIGVLCQFLRVSWSSLFHIAHSCRYSSSVDFRHRIKKCNWLRNKIGVNFWTMQPHLVDEIWYSGFFVSWVKFTSIIFNENPSYVSEF